MRVCLAKAARTSCSMRCCNWSRLSDSSSGSNRGYRRRCGEHRPFLLLPSVVMICAVRPVVSFGSSSGALTWGMHPTIRRGCALGQDAAQVVQDFSVGAFDEAVLFVSRRSLLSKRTPLSVNILWSSWRIGSHCQSVWCAVHQRREVFLDCLLAAPAVASAAAVSRTNREKQGRR
jgi:hypothetical protein